MPRKRKRKSTGILDSIRKPTAPPAQKFGEEKAEEKARPSGRKAKHKKRIEGSTDDGDL